MPFEIELPNRLLNLIKKGLGTAGALNFNSIAVYSVVSDVNGEIEIEFSEPYSETSTLIIDWRRTPVDLTGLNESEVQEELNPIFVYVTNLTNTSVSLIAKKYKENTALAFDGVTVIPIIVPGTDPRTELALNVVVIEVAG